MFLSLNFKRRKLFSSIFLKRLLFPGNVIISAYSERSNSRDGMIQRAIAIDRLAEPNPRTYLNISYSKYFIPRLFIHGNVFILDLNYFLFSWLIVIILSRATLVYLHSVYNAAKIFPLNCSRSLILDLHGIVPEEEMVYGRPCRAAFLSLIEWYYVNHAKILVLVSQNMKDFVLDKYPRALKAKATILYPIIPPTILPSKSLSISILQSTRLDCSIVYAGGIQPWQNVEMMLDLSRMCPDYKFTFLSGEPDHIESLANTMGISDLSILSVPPDQVHSFYLTSTFGLLLRSPDQINSVACPTKLIEYMFWGAIPITIDGIVGDFNQSNMKSITYSDFASNALPSKNELSQMRCYNHRTILRLYRKYSKFGQQLSSIFYSIDSFDFS